MSTLTDKEIDSHIGNQLRTLRIHRKINLDALAQELNVTYQQVQKYQKGVSRLSGSKLYRASLALDAPVTAFFSGLPTPATPDPFAMTLDEVEIIALLRANRATLPSRTIRDLVQLLANSTS